MIEFAPGRYAIDSLGNVYSLRNNGGNRRTYPLLMKPQVSSNGYLYVNLYLEIDGIKKKTLALIHRLVALNYVNNPDKKPEVNHIDGVKTNNIRTNLEWVTSLENTIHAVKLGLRIPNSPLKKGDINEKCHNSKPIMQLDFDGNIICEFPSISEAQRQGFSQGNISSVIAGTRKSHKGFKWAFKT